MKKKRILNIINLNTITIFITIFFSQKSQILNCIKKKRKKKTIKIDNRLLFLNFFYFIVK